MLLVHGLDRLGVAVKKRCLSKGLHKIGWKKQKPGLSLPDGRRSPLMISVPREQ